MTRPARTPDRPFRIKPNAAMCRPRSRSVVWTSRSPGRIMWPPSSVAAEGVRPGSRRPRPRTVAAAAPGWPAKRVGRAQPRLRRRRGGNMSRRNPEHGGMLPLLMVTLVVMAVLGTGAISVGRLLTVKRDLQNTADAIALQAAYRMERLGLPNNQVADLAPANLLAPGNIMQPVRVRFVRWGDQGAPPSQFSYVQIDVETREPFVPTASFRELLGLQGRVHATARARVDEDIFRPSQLRCVYANTGFGRSPLGCSVDLSRRVTDRYQLTPHAFRRDGSGREQHLALRDFESGRMLIGVSECEYFVAVRNFSCAPTSGDKLVVRYNKPVLVQ